MLVTNVHIIHILAFVHLEFMRSWSVDLSLCGFFFDKKEYLKTEKNSLPVYTFPSLWSHLMIPTLDEWTRSRLSGGHAPASRRLPPPGPCSLTETRTLVGDYNHRAAVIQSRGRWAGGGFPAAPAAWSGRREPLPAGLLLHFQSLKQHPTRLVNP